MGGTTLEDRLRAAGVRPSAQRMAVAQYVLTTDEHPSAEHVLARVTGEFPFLSRATVYNTLNLFVAKGLLRQLVLAEGKVVFDPKLERHHHFVDDATGRIDDIPWDAVRVGDATRLAGYDVREYMVVLRGRRVDSPAQPAPAPSKRHVTSTATAHVTSVPVSARARAGRKNGEQRR